MTDNLPTLAQVQSLMHTSPDEYWSPTNPARELAVIEEQQSPRGRGMRLVDKIRQRSGSDWFELSSSFDALPPSIREAVEAELSAGPILMLTPATWDELQHYRSVPYGAELVREWGHDAPARVAQVEARMQRFADSLSDIDFKSLLHWFNAASPNEQMAIERAMAR